jgi:hypothetical protein
MTTFRFGAAAGNGTRWGAVGAEIQVIPGSRGEAMLILGALLAVVILGGIAIAAAA